jgi:hypothetical protein
MFRLLHRFRDQVNRKLHFADPAAVIFSGSAIAAAFSPEVLDGFFVG